MHATACPEPFHFETVSVHLELNDCGRCQNQMGAYYSEKHDYPQAIAWFRKAAAHKGLSVAKHNLACNLYNCHEFVEGRQWFQRAAEENYPASIYYLGVIYEAENDIRAIDCWRKAAALGDERAAKKLAK